MDAIDANVPFLTQLSAFFNLFNVMILRAFEHLIAEKYYGFFESPTAYSVSRYLISRHIVYETRTGPLFCAELQ